MALTVKKITLWRCEVANRPGALANTLDPITKAGADLQVLMGYRFPGNESRAAIELFPVSGKKASSAASAAGLKPSAIPALLVEGDNKPGVAYAIARGLADAGINLDFLVAQAIGRRYVATCGFESEQDATKAAGVIKKAGGTKKK
jgi:hypothetical protein